MNLHDAIFDGQSHSGGPVDIISELNRATKAAIGASPNKGCQFESVIGCEKAAPVAVARCIWAAQYAPEHVFLARHTVITAYDQFCKDELRRQNKSVEIVRSISE